HGQIGNLPGSIGRLETCRHSRPPTALVRRFFPSEHERSPRASMPVDFLSSPHIPIPRYTMRLPGPPPWSKVVERLTATTRCRNALLQVTPEGTVRVANLTRVPL